jgi:ssDNA-binding replication factor A large subunit
MMNEELVEQILSLNPTISKEALLERLEGERRRTGGLFSGEILLRIVAAEFGVNPSKAEVAMPTLSISNLIAGLYDVTVVGRVVAIFPSKAFNGKRSGKLASLLITDKTGILRAVMWNEQTSLIETGKIAVGQIARFSHAYTKEDRNGKTELHVGGKCETEINPADIHAEDYPTIERFLTRISELTSVQKNAKVNVLGLVTKLFPASSFERQDSSLGRVMRLGLADETGEITVVAWNERVDELEKTLKRGVKLQIVNGSVKKAMGEGLEVHVDGGTYVEAIPVAESFLKVADLKEGQANVNIQAEVATKPETREVRTSKGETVKLTTLRLEDETGQIQLTAWRKHADAAGSLKPGNKIIIRNAHIKKGFGELLEISTRETTSITITV